MKRIILCHVLNVVHKRRLRQYYFLLVDFMYSVFECDLDVTVSLGLGKNGTLTTFARNIKV